MFIILHLKLFDIDYTQENSILNQEISFIISQLIIHKRHNTTDLVNCCYLANPAPHLFYKVILAQRHSILLLIAFETLHIVVADYIVETDDIEPTKSEILAKFIFIKPVHW